MKFRLTAIVAFGIAALGLAATHQAGEFTVHLRGRVQPFKAVDTLWEPVSFDHSFGRETSAIVICDMWDKHWCSGATKRVGLLAQRMDPVLRKAREAGILIIHAPSDTMDFYKAFPQRLAVLQAPKAQPPPPLDLKDPPLPIDDSDGGCDTPGDKQYKAWSKENSLLSMGPHDFISDDGSEIYNLLRAKRHPHSLSDGRAHQHVRADPDLRHPADEPLGHPVRPGSRFDGRHVQSGGSPVCDARPGHGAGDRAHREILVPHLAQPGLPGRAGESGGETLNHFYGFRR